MDGQNQLVFYCEKCCYSSNKKTDFNKHLSTIKHNCSNLTIIENCHKCICGKKYKHDSSLYRHKKKCKIMIDKTIQSQNEKVVDLIENAEPKEIIQFLLKENSEFKKMLIEQSNQMIEMAKNNTNIYNQNNINSNNKSFNLNFFLNETCKNAMNITDFVNSIKIDLCDLEKTGEKGYVEGISNIFIKNLNNIEQHLRPLHCSDTKREVFYIKDNNEWIKETDDKPILTKAIKNIAHANIKQIKSWTQKYPAYSNYNSKTNDIYLQIVSNSMNDSTDIDGINNIHKIISNISKEVAIDKKLAII